MREEWQSDRDPRREISAQISYLLEGDPDVGLLLEEEFPSGER